MWALVCAVVVVLVILAIRFDSFSDTPVVAFDGRTYGTNGGDVKSANALAKTNKFLIDVMRHIRNKYRTQNEPLDNPHSSAAEFRAFLDRLFANYDPNVIRENVPLTTTNTSYVTQKGEEIGFCLKNKTGNPEIDENTMQFVALHELTHIGTKKYGHGEQYWRNFRFILHEATETGKYYPINYSERPTVYCGLPIKHNPYFD